VYLAAIATHPLAAMLKGFDLQVYLGGARQAMRHPRDLYTWTDDGHLGIKFTYPPFAALLFAAGGTVPFRVLLGLVANVELLTGLAWFAVTLTAASRCSGRSRAS
jgi:hypothetical protein